MMLAICLLLSIPNREARKRTKAGEKKHWNERRNENVLKHQKLCILLRGIAIARSNSNKHPSHTLGFYSLMLLKKMKKTKLNEIIKNKRRKFSCVYFFSRFLKNSAKKKEKCIENVWEENHETNMEIFLAKAKQQMWRVPKWLRDDGSGDEDVLNEYKQKYIQMNTYTLSLSLSLRRGT